MSDILEMPGRPLSAVPSTEGRCLDSWLIGLRVIVVICIFGLGPAAGQEDEYFLGTGDRLRINVFGQPDLSGEFAVDSSGRITLPLVGDVLVVNRSLDDVRQLIVSALKPDYLKNPQVGVEVIGYRPFYIIGEVANPGSYPYVGGMRAINAVAMAGGFTYRAKQKDLLITRARGDGNEERAGQETLIYPGDVIEVRERFF